MLLLTFIKLRIFKKIWWFWIKLCHLETFYRYSTQVYSYYIANFFDTQFELQTGNNLSSETHTTIETSVSDSIRANTFIGPLSYAIGGSMTNLYDSSTSTNFHTNGNEGFTGIVVDLQSEMYLSKIKLFFGANNLSQIAVFCQNDASVWTNYNSTYKMTFIYLHSQMMSEWMHFYLLAFFGLFWYSSPPQLRYPQLSYFCSNAILNWVQKNSS